MLDEPKVRSALRTIRDSLTPAEATAILDVARLAASVDKKTNINELRLILSLTRVICEMAGLVEMPIPTTSIDAQRLTDICTSLIPIGARELAYAVAFLVMIHDLEITREEANLAAMLGDAMVLEPARAAQLAGDMEALARAAR